MHMLVFLHDNMNMFFLVMEIKLNWPGSGTYSFMLQYCKIIKPTLPLIPLYSKYMLYHFKICYSVW